MENMMGMKQKTALLGAVAALMFTGSAFASPSPAVPAGSKFISDNTFETLILCAADSSGLCGLTGGVASDFKGIGITQNVSSGGGFAGQTYGGFSGSPPPYLYSEFSGFVVRHIDAPTATTDGKIYLTGGQLNYYSFSAPLCNDGVTGVCGSKFVPDNTGTASSQIALVKGLGVGQTNLPTLWLGLTPVAEDSSGDTVIITIPFGSTLLTVGKSTADAFLDVNLLTPGTAGPDFEHCVMPDSFAPGGCADISYNASGETNKDPGTKTVWPVSGTDNLRQVINAPEPATLALFGAGLMGLGALRRRRKAKS